MLVAIFSMSKNNRAHRRIVNLFFSANFVRQPFTHKLGGVIKTALFFLLQNGNKNNTGKLIIFLSFTMKITSFRQTWSCWAIILNPLYRSAIIRNRTWKRVNKFHIYSEKTKIFGTKTLWDASNEINCKEESDSASCIKLQLIVFFY